MEISVIVINYNAGPSLTNAVKSVIDHSAVVEVIVVDNASSDNSIDLLRKNIKIKKLKVIKNQNNIGFAKANNLAASKSSGDYLLFLNPDATMNSEGLSKLMDTASKNPDSLITPALKNTNKSIQPSCYRRQSIWNALKQFWFGVKHSYSKYRPTGNKASKVHCAVAAVWLLPKTLWNKLNGFDEKFFLYFEDIDFCDRLNKIGFSVIYEPSAASTHVHGLSAQKNTQALELFNRSAILYHGLLKKKLIDFLILTSPVLPVFLVWRILIFVFAFFGYFILPSRYFPLFFLRNIFKENFLFWSWANFDGEHYLSIASFGYRFIQGFPQYAFFPLFPYLIRLFSHLTLGVFDAFTSSLILVHTFTLLAFWFFYKWLKLKRLSQPLTVLLGLVFFPSSVFLASVYTEPLFLLLATSTMYFSEKKKWSKAALLSALATATRINGIFVAAFFIVKYFSDTRKVSAKSFIHSILAFTGILAFMAYLWSLTGDPLAFYHSQSAWGKADPTSPLVTLVNYFKAATLEFVPDLIHLVVLLEIIVTVWVIFLFIKLVKNKWLEPPYIVYLAGNLTLPLITGSLGSMPRFALTLFPLFVVIPKLSKRVIMLTFTIYLIVLALGTILFVRGYWYA